MELSTIATIGAWVVGGGRALTGVYFLADPSAGAQTWTGGTQAPTRYLARAVGGRDLAIGAGIIWAILADQQVVPWVLASVAGDAVDAAFAGAMLDDEHKSKALALAGGFGVLGAVTAALLAAS